MRIEYIEFTSVGLVRTVNQDSLFAAVKDEYGLFVVADGMGGHSYGEIASARLTAALGEWWENFSQELYDFEKCCEDLLGVMEGVNESIFNEYTDQGIICGTTVAAVFIHGRTIFVINSGDTRIYSYDGFKFKQESRDHVFGREAVISGKMTAKEAKKSPNRNKLTAAVGSKEELKLYAASFPLKCDRLFICSDGVYRYCKKSVIKAAMAKKSPEKLIESVVNKNGAADNFSFIRIRIFNK